MSGVMINESIDKDIKYPIVYVYLIGHGFSDVDYKAELLGRFGTTVEAEYHVEKLNTDIRINGNKGCVSLTKEFPFLILEIVALKLEENKEKIGVPFKFYSFDWKNNTYTESNSVDKNTVLKEYKDRVKNYMKVLEDYEQN